MPNDEVGSDAVSGTGLDEPLFGTDRRGCLLAAAARVFSEKGYRATSMNDLADAVGISKPTLYHYVSSKQQLLVELYEAVMSGSLYAMDRAGHHELSPAESLRKVLAQRIAYICRHSRLVQIFIEEEGELPLNTTDTVRRLHARREDAFVRLVERGVADGSFQLDVDPRMAVRAITGAMTYIYKWYEPDGPITPAQVAQELSAYLVAGLTAPVSVRSAL